MTSDATPTPSGTRRRALILALAGLPGILSLLLVLPDTPGVPAAALLLQPAVLLLVAAFAGSRLAARAGLHLVSGFPLARRAGELTTGVVLGLGIATVDHGLRGAWQAAPGVPPAIVEAWSVSGLVAGLLYGAVVEEVMFRWFTMSLLVVVFARIAGRLAQPPRWTLPAAAMGAAALFAASHLPALAAAGAMPATGALARTLLLNGIAGVVFGLLCARRDLVAAMLAHGGTHLGFAAAALALEIWP